ncbi:MAG: T9SS type A sorting domain-containing protein [Bacteroidota bacterium]
MKRSLLSSGIKNLLQSIFAFVIVLFLMVSNPLSVMSQNCTVNANVDLTICAHDPMTLIGQKSGEGAVVTTWSQLSGPSVYIVSPHSLTTSVTGYTGGHDYKFRISTTCGDGTLIYDDVTYTVKPVSNANAGPSFDLAPGTPAGTLLGNTPLNFGEVGTWAIVGANNGVTIVDPHSPTSAVNISGASCGNTILQWGITNPSGCGTFDTLIISNCGGESPVSAGSGQTLSNCYSTTQSTSLSASNGGCGIRGQIGTWLVIDGPNIPTIADPHSNHSGISNLIQGTYTLRWVVAGPCVNGTSNVHITVPAPTSSVTPASVTSGSQTYCDARSSTVLVGNLPLYTNESVLWTQTGGPSATIVSNTNRVTNITGLDGYSSYTFRYTINNSLTGCSSSADVTIGYATNPTLSISTASPLMLNCGVSSAILNYSQSGSGGVEWSIISGPSGCTYTIPTSYVSATASPDTINGLAEPGTYVIRLRKIPGNGAGCISAFADIVVISSAVPTGSNSGTKQVLACNITSTGLAGNDPYVGIGRWTQVSGPNTAVIDSINRHNSQISSLTNGLYIFRWVITGGPACPTQQSDVSVLVSQSNPTLSNAGSDQTVCANSPLILSANTPGLNETGTWTVNPSVGISFSNVHSPNAVVNGLTASNSYTFTWTITNSCNSSASICTITTNAITGPIQSNAGSDQCLPSGTTSVTLAGNNPASGVGNWTKISGGLATITNSALQNTTVTGLTDGTYTFEWAISQGGGCTASLDTVMITISHTTTNANAGTDQNICGNSATLAGNIPTYGTGSWSQTMGDGDVVITDTTLNNTTVTNLNSGVYEFTWTVHNGACSSTSDAVTLNVSNTPTTAHAGADFDVCGSASTNLNGNIITTGVGYWSIINGPNYPNISDITSPTTAVSNLITGAYTFRWTSTNGDYCTLSTSNVIVTVVRSATAGPDQSYCETTTLTNLIGEVNSIGTWSQTSGPSPATINATSDNSATASGLSSGSAYTFRYTIGAIASCPSTFAETHVTLYPVPTAADAGEDRNLCNADTVHLNGNSPTSGIGIWSKLAGPAGESYSNNTDPLAIVSGFTPGTYVFVWTISTNISCSISDQMRIENSAAPTPAVAGPDQAINCSTVVTMAANNPSTGLGTWTRSSGPNVPVITSPILPNTTITGLEPGIYTYTWTITNGTCPSSSDNISFTVDPTPTPANAGPDQNLCNILTATMAAIDPTAGTGLWSKMSGPSSYVITTPTLYNTTITGLTYGTYVFRWTTTLGPCTSYSDVTINVYDTPTTADVSGTAVDNCVFSDLNLIGNNPSVGTGVWSQISGADAFILDPNSYSTSVLGVDPGVYQFQWTISNGSCTSSSANVTITVHDIPTMAIAGMDQAFCNTTSTTLHGNPVTSGIGTWSVSSGPAVTFADIHDSITGISNLTPGTYILQWQIVNGPCTSTDFMQIVNYDLPTTAAAGADQEYCNVTSFNMNANTPVHGTGTWTYVSGPPSYHITSPNSPTSTITSVNTGTYVFRWTISNGSGAGTCTPSTSEVTIHNYIQPNIANAGVDKIVCGTSQSMTANSAVSGTIGTWTQTYGDSAGISSPHANNSNITGLSEGTYIFTWTIANGTCASTHDDVTLNVYTTPTTANAGPTQNLCINTPTTSTNLAGNIASVGNGLWSQTAGTSIAVFNDNSSPTTSVSNLSPGTYVFIWTITNGGCSSQSSVTINVYEVPTTANAGSNQTICLSSPLALAGNSPSVGHGVWSKFSGPNTPIFTTPTSPTTGVTGLNSGVYDLKWTITNGTCTSSDDVIITIDALATVANAGAYQNICNLTTGTLAGNIASVGTGTWSEFSGPAASITSINSPTSWLTGLSAGTYIFQWQIVNGTCNSTDTVTINVYNLPTVADAGSSQFYCNATTFNMNGNTPAANHGIGTWTKVSGPASYTITSPNSPTTTITGVTTGTYVFRWTISNGNCTSSTSDVTITNYIAPNTSIAGPLQNVCGTSTIMAANMATSGTTGTWTQVSGPNTAVISDLNLNTASLTGLVQGAYVMRWTIANGTCTPSINTVTIGVYTIPTTSNAGTDQTFCSEFTTTHLNANTPSVGTGLWSQVTGPNTAVITTPTSPTSGLSSLVFGQYKFRWTISNGTCSNYSDVYVNLVKCVDLGITKRLSDPDPILYPHHHIHKLDTVTFTIVLMNHSTNTATNNIQVLDTLPSVFHYISSTTTAGTYTSGTGIWAISTLAALDSAILTIRARVDTSAQNNVYILTHSYPDLDSTNNKSFASVTAKHSSSGHDGGLESNGNLVSKVALRNFIRHREGEVTLETTKNLQMFADIQTNKSILSTNSSDLSQLIPLTGVGSTGFVTTPTDLISVTNATEVIAVDYFTDSTDRQGSVLGITTNPSTVYSHTKMVCDRLNGASLKDVNYVNINGKPFYIAHLVQENGEVDYTINFVAYKNGNQYTIDNQWDLNSYHPTGNNPVLNFQVWAINEEYTQNFVEQIFSKMQTLGYSVNYLNNNQAVIPSVYVINGNYDNGNITLQLNNSVAASSIELTGTTAAIENGTRTNFAQSENISTDPKSQTNVNIGNIFDIGFNMSNNVQSGNDVLYFADGPWGVDIDTAGATINSFAISALNNVSYTDCYNLLRNATVDGTVKTYVSIFRDLKAANNITDITNYKFVEFNAMGSGAFDLIVSKKGITTWNNQYKTTLNLTSTQTHYKIAFSDLYNSAYQNNFSGNDVVAVVFTKNGNSSSYQDFNISVNNLHFSGLTTGINQTIDNSKDVKLTVYPNPASDQTLISFNLPQSSKLKVSLYTEQGKLISVLKEGYYNEGNHTIDCNVANLGSGIYIMKFETDKYLLHEKIVVMHK